MCSVSLSVEHLAHTDRDEVEFGDLTLLVGPRASGKSVFLRLFKLLQDHGPIVKTLKRYGYSDEADAHGDPLLTLMFGEGMGGIWGEQTRVALDGKAAEPSPCRAFAIRE